MSAEKEFHEKRMNALFGKGWDSQPTPENDFEKVSVEYSIVDSRPADCRGPLILDDDQPLPDPFADFLARCADELSLAKNGQVDASWHEEIGSLPRLALSKEFLARSDARMERLAEKVRKLFGEHKEEAGEAVALAKDLRDSVRQEFNAAA